MGCFFLFYAKISVHVPIWQLYDRITWWVYGVVRIGSIYTIYLHEHIPVLSRAQMTANITTSHLYCLTGAKDEVKGF